MVRKGPTLGRWSAIRNVDTGEVVGMDGSGRLRLDPWSEPVELLLADGLDLWSPGASRAPARQP